MILLRFMLVSFRSWYDDVETRRWRGGRRRHRDLRWLHLSHDKHAGQAASRLILHRLSTLISAITGNLILPELSSPALLRALSP